jgi:hypothetical protein
VEGFRSLLSLDDVQTAGEAREQRLPDAADDGARNEVGVRLERLLVRALVAVELLGLFRKALGVQLRTHTRRSLLTLVEKRPPRVSKETY